VRLSDDHPRLLQYGTSTTALWSSKVSPASRNLRWALQLAVGAVISSTAVGDGRRRHANVYSRRSSISAAVASCDSESKRSRSHHATCYNKTKPR
jgi:hypothetical protein